MAALRGRMDRAQRFPGARGIDLHVAVEGPEVSARERILGRLKGRLSEGGAPGARAHAIEVRLDAQAQTGPRPTQSRPAAENLIAQFQDKARKAEATVSVVSSMSELPMALAEELRNRNLGASIRMGGDPALAPLDWGGLEVSHGLAG